MSIDYKSISDEILEKRNNYIRKRKAIIRKVTALVLPLVLAVGTIFVLDARNLMSNQPSLNDASVNVENGNLRATVEITDLEEINQILQLVELNLQNGAGDYEKASLWQNGFNESAEYLFKVTNSEGSIILVVITKNYLLTQSGTLIYIPDGEYQKLMQIIE